MKTVKQNLFLSSGKHYYYHVTAHTARAVHYRCVCSDSPFFKDPVLEKWGYWQDVSENVPVKSTDKFITLFSGI